LRHADRYAALRCCDAGGFAPNADAHARANVHTHTQTYIHRDIHTIANGYRLADSRA
jgi:hypothetical protein